MFDLNGRFAVITGASSGLGADAAIAYAEAGASVAVLARREDRLEATKAKIEAKGGRCIAIQCDVTNEESVKKAVDKILQEFGRIDILLNNAGIAIGGGVETLTEGDWDKSMNTNVKGIFLISKYIVPQMKENKYGKIINIASVNAVVANKGDQFIRHGYNASKAAVFGLTKGMAASYAEYGITVNAVGPGLFESEMTSSTLFQSKKFLQTYNSLTPASRPGKRGELNGTLLYLSSDASNYTQGQLIIVDGGFSII